MPGGVGGEVPRGIPLSRSIPYESASRAFGISLGTGDGTFTVEPSAQNGGIAQWGFLRSFSAAARAQSKNALGQAYLLVGKPNVLRIDVPESDRPIPMDDVGRSLNELPLVARSMAEASGQHIKEVFLSEVVQPFVPCSKVSICL